MEARAQARARGWADGIMSSLDYREETFYFAKVGLRMMHIMEQDNTRIYDEAYRAAFWAAVHAVYKHRNRPQLAAHIQGGRVSLVDAQTGEILAEYKD